MKCHQCGQEVFLPFRCPYCGDYFCPEHRLPENHDCPRKDLARTPKEEPQSIAIKNEKAHEYTITYAPTFFPKRKLGFSRKETEHLTIGALLVMSVGVSSWIYTFPYDYALLASFTLILTASFFIHEIAHKITAQRKGLWAEFRLTLIGAVLTLFSILSPLFKIISPGAVMISGSADKEDMGKISIMGPTTNIALSTLFFAASILLPTYDLIFSFGAAFNAWIALFNLIPIGILDGFKVFSWNKKTWALAFTISLCLTLVSYNNIL